MLIHTTGPKKFNIIVRQFLRKKKCKLNQYELICNNKKIKITSEKDFFNFLGFPYIKPKDRKNVTLSTIKKMKK